MIDFPANPTLGQQFTAAGVTWTFDGTKWTAGGQSVAYLPLAGGTMLGPIVLAADPAAALQPATKQYVDINAPSLASGFVNKFRNGTMDVWQRGMTVSAGAGAGWVMTADGWQVSATGAACSVQAANNATRTVYSLQLNAASGLTALGLHQRIESYVAARLAGQTVTVQFRILNNTANPITPQIATTFANAPDNFGAVTNDLVAVNLQPVSAASTAIVAYTFNVSASAINGYGVYLQFGNALNAASGYVRVSEADIRVTPGWPVGLCANPPSPELRHVQAERAFCQRYYWDPANGAASPYGFTLGGPSPGAQAYTYAPIILPVQMRAIPTAAVRNQNYSGASSVTISPATNQTCASSVVTTLASGNYYIQFNCGFNAEL